MNYDLYKTTSGAMFLQLGGKYYWLNKPGHSESRARTGISRTEFGKAELTGNLRSQFRDKLPMTDPVDKVNVDYEEDDEYFDDDDWSSVPF